MKVPMSEKVKNAFEYDIDRIQMLIYNRLDFLYSNEPEDSLEYRKLLNCLNEIRRSEPTVAKNATVQNEGWEKTSSKPLDNTWRLKVPNGWLYKHISGADHHIGICFVPDK